jgi:cell division protein FtsN
MKIRTFSIIIVCVLLICSCKSTKKTTQSTSPYQPAQETYRTEQNYSSEASDRTESVRNLDPSDRTMYRFYVIIGSFRDVNNARRQTTELTRKGFTPSILEGENGLYRISVGGYNDERAARAQIADIRAFYAEHRDVWLLIRRQ